MSDNPYSAPISNELNLSNEDPSGPWAAAIRPLRDVSGWSRFLGINLIVIGALYCLTIVGAVVGWIPIWIGVLMLKSSDNFKIGSASSTREGAAQLAKIIRIMGILAALSLVLLGLYFVFAVLIVWAGLRAPPGPPAAF